MLFSLLALLPSVHAVHVIFGGTQPVVRTRMDPIVSPGAVRFMSFPMSSHLVGMLTLRWTLQVSTHVHDVFGGSGFAETYDYNRAVNSQCTTITIPQDKSNYWVVGDTDHDNQSCMTLTEPTARCILRQP